MTIDTNESLRGDREFADRVGLELRKGADELDAATLSRLNRSRQAALDVLGRKSSGLTHRRRWLPAAVTAWAAVVIVAVWQGQAPDPGIPVSPAMVDEMTDLELLLDDGDLEMFEDLEFFVWLPEDETEDIG